MQVVQGRNVNTVWVDGLWRLKTSGVIEESRAGKVRVLPEPLTSVYTHPWERVLFHPTRDANPFFHLMEAMWMLAGSESLDFIANYNSRMKEFSDDGKTLPGAYGYRWRTHFERDQLEETIQLLLKDPHTRRAVIGMWDPMEDLGKQSNDLPCNTHCYFRGHDGLLDMTVCCRSNDAIWGAYGANVVHFSILHELIAQATGMLQGKMYQVSNNFHIYDRHWDLLNFPHVVDNHYETRVIKSPPLLGDSESYTTFLEDCETMVGYEWNFSTEFFQKVVYPAAIIWREYQLGDMRVALERTKDQPYYDWFIAMEAWLQRRVK